MELHLYYLNVVLTSSFTLYFRFKARASEADYISIIRGGGCWSYIGKTGNKQQLSLGHGCVYNGVIIHEFMHAVGIKIFFI